MRLHRIKYFRLSLQESGGTVEKLTSHDVFDAVFCDEPADNAVNRAGLEGLIHYIQCGDTVVADSMSIAHLQYRGTVHHHSPAD